MSLTYGFALKSTDNSSEFSSALQSVAGDGIAQHGGRFSFAVNGFTVTLSSGYALAAGRWLESDELLTMHISAAGNNEDRVDAIAVRVDYEARKATLTILQGVDPVAVRANPALLRYGGQYLIVLYLVRVRRGATSLTPGDVTDLRDDGDLCGRVVPLSAIAGDVLYVYNFLNGGIDAEVSRLIGLSNVVIAKANAAIAELSEQIQQASGGAEIGEIMTGRNAPIESGWLLCDGAAVPSEYAALSTLLGGTLPDISTAADRYKTYIFGGTTTGV